MGFAEVAIALVPGVDKQLMTVADRMYDISVGELDKILTTLTAERVSEVTMLGKVTKEVMFNGQVRVDNHMRRLLASLKDHSDDTIMLALVRELAAAGIGVLDQTALIRSLMPAAGVLSKRMPTEAEQGDMEFGFRIAKAIGGLDIGQTVVVKKRAVMAVEAIEGTDACIRRGGELGRGGVTVAKVAKPNQDMRFDVPGIGPDTILAMIEAGATALVIEAGKTLLVSRAEVLKLADDSGITIIAM